MQIRWMNGRGDRRETQSVSEFHFEGLLHFVAFDPDYRRLRIYRKIAIDEELGFAVVSPID